MICLSGPESQKMCMQTQSLCCSVGMPRSCGKFVIFLHAGMAKSCWARLPRPQLLQGFSDRCHAAMSMRVQAQM